MLRSQDHSRSGESLYIENGSSQGHGGSVTTPLRTTGTRPSSSASVAPSRESLGVCTCTLSGGYAERSAGVSTAATVGGDRASRKGFLQRGFTVAAMSVTIAATVIGSGDRSLRQAER